MVAVLTAAFPFHTGAAPTPSWHRYPSRQKMAKAIWKPHARSVPYTEGSKAEDKAQPRRSWAAACVKGAGMR